MLEIIIFTTSVVLVLAASYWVSATQNQIYQKTRKFEKWKTQEDLPRELELASLYSIEKEISITEPVPLYGQADQVFQARNGDLIIVDTKTRKHHQVHDSDIAQLSVYAAILRLAEGETVSPYGYIRTVVNHGSYDSIHYTKVKLLSTQAVITRAKKIMQQK